MKRFYYLLLLCPCLVLCCKSNVNNDQKNGQVSLLPGGPAWGALYQQRAAEYRALCHQAYNIAMLRLDQKVQVQTALPKAIITDIDETVLDNSPYFIREAKKGRTYSDSTWIRWTAERKCDTVPGAAGFLKHAKELGVTVFYVTNRFQAERQATLENLRRFDLPNADSDHLFLVDENNSSKESRRMAINKNFEVVLLLGDNLGDFSHAFDGLTSSERGQQVNKDKNNFGDRFIVFPNSMYGTWEDVLYDKAANNMEDKNTTLNKLLNK